MSQTRAVIIVAGGKGERMNAHIPKQFLEIKGKPVLMHTMLAFRNASPQIRIILVLPGNQIDYWTELCALHQFDVPHAIAPGGSTRFHSVCSGLKLLNTEELVAVHDGVRPLVSADTIARCFEAAHMSGAAIPVVDLVDSIREVTAGGSRSVDRSAYKLVQTPQVFTLALLKKAYELEFSPFFTDDASVVEALGERIQLVEGNRENIKITTEFDLTIAQSLL